jgi:hypothetical protein
VAFGGGADALVREEMSQGTDGAVVLGRNGHNGFWNGASRRPITQFQRLSRSRRVTAQATRTMSEQSYNKFIAHEHKQQRRWVAGYNVREATYGAEGAWGCVVARVGDTTGFKGTARDSGPPNSDALPLNTSEIWGSYALPPGTYFFATLIRARCSRPNFFNTRRPLSSKSRRRRFLAVPPGAATNATKNHTPQVSTVFHE